MKDLLLTPFKFFLKLLKRLGIAAIVIILSLAFGAIGYRVTEGLDWIDATLNAAMILTAMGPVTELHTTGGKLFAIIYAIFSGLIFITIAAILMEPIVQRILRRVHLETREKKRK